jgi:hypothetical protein
MFFIINLSCVSTARIKTMNRARYSTRKKTWFDTWNGSGHSASNITGQ